MLRTDLPDHRRASEADLVAALRERDALALAEAYHRTIPAAHATARRLLAGSAEVEALLRAVYGDLWQSPPTGRSLEGWIRARCFELGAADLRERNRAPASPSVWELLDDLPKPEVRYLDAAERALAELPAEHRRALLLAHDKGVAAGDQQTAGAAEALDAALLTMSGPEAEAEATGCETEGLADWVLGLLAPTRAAEMTTAAADASCAGRVKALRRGRRRLEGLPPTPDMGHRVLVLVLAGGAAAVVPRQAPAASAPGLRSALDADAMFEPPTRPDGEDTGDLTPVGAGHPYAELTELDDPASDNGHPAAGPGDTLVASAVDGEATGTARPSTVPDIPFHDEDTSRGMGRRVLSWLLGTLIVLGGIALGLYLGITFAPRLYDALQGMF